MTLSQEKTQTATALIFITYIALYGPIKYSLLVLSSNAYYLPHATIITSAALCFLFCATKIKVTICLSLLYIITEIINGLESSNNLKQVILGSWALIPILLGYLCSETFTKRPSFWVRYFEALIYIVTAGLAIDILLELPWGEIKIDDGNESVSLTREAGYLGVPRLAGLSGNHINASTILTLAASYFLTFSQAGKPRKIIAYLVGMVGLVLTLNKSLIALYIILGFVLSLPPKIQTLAFKTTCLPLAFLSAILPLISYLFRGESLLYTSPQLPLLKTIGTRWETFWPYMIDLIITHSHHPLGIGIGAFGMASLRSNGEILASGDNITLYLYANLGILGVLFFAYAIISTCTAINQESRHTKFLLAIATIISGYGIMVNIVEMGVLGFALGALANKHSRRKTLRPSFL